ncbi:hypothetical protein QBC44DRAFT_371980 [Cladorrhinum sp. PSN332]|nr:hypothetical protein QBC44DRAFT_371980 [Cladorrhinum sp. PSN332]
MVHRLNIKRPSVLGIIVLSFICLAPATVQSTSIARSEYQPDQRPPDYDPTAVLLRDTLQRRNDQQFGPGSEILEDRDDRTRDRRAIFRIPSGRVGGSDPIGPGPGQTGPGQRGSGQTGFGQTGDPDPVRPPSNDCRSGTGCSSKDRSSDQNGPDIDAPDGDGQSYSAPKPTFLRGGSAVTSPSSAPTAAVAQKNGAAGEPGSNGVRGLTLVAMTVMAGFAVYV